MQFLKYTVVRLALFLVVFAALFWGLRWDIWLSALVALVVAFCVSYLFFNKLRTAATQEVAGRLSGAGTRRSRRVGQTEAEDAAAEDRD